MLLNGDLVHAQGGACTRGGVVGGCQKNRRKQGQVHLQHGVSVSIEGRIEGHIAIRGRTYVLCTHAGVHACTCVRVCVCILVGLCALWMYVRHVSTHMSVLVWSRQHYAAVTDYAVLRCRYRLRSITLPLPTTPEVFLFLFLFLCRAVAKRGRQCGSRFASFVSNVQLKLSTKTWYLLELFKIQGSCYDFHLYGFHGTPAWLRDTIGFHCTPAWLRDSIGQYM